MAKSRDKVQQEGFWDEEVKKPEHDKVVMWADDNADLVLRTAFPEHYGRAWKAEDIEWSVSAGHQALAAATVEAFLKDTPRPDPIIKRTTWEQVVRDADSGARRYPRSLGFADLVIEALQATVFVSSPERVDPGQPGAVDIQLGRTRLGGRDGILVEAKSVLPSRGELIRQLRHYATVFRGPMVVVSPDNSYAKLLRAQGFRFVQCPKDLP